LLVILSACGSLVPATVPPQLQHTPGSPITITDNQIVADAFTLAFPDGWRVITNVAELPLELILVDPDDDLIIRISQMCPTSEATPAPDIHYRAACLQANSATVFLTGEVVLADSERFDPFFDLVLESVIFH